ncbi:MAG TPA: META domain-containing protein, partial [Candidatus Limnocylindrales bacterium]|nr:META domain-containing protein [Candidatus Limnocylindrales bacterium]
MRSLPLALLVVAALLAPAATAAAGDQTSPPSRSFIVTGLVFGDQRVEASGKLGIEGGRLFASVGCNTIGGTVLLDGDTLTIPEPLAMTEMACPGAVGDTEAMLIKVLQAGPFRIGNGAWTGNGAAILVEELPAGPGPGPGASLTPPDGIVSSSLQPGGVEPMVSCPPIPDGVNGTPPADGAPNAGSGGGSAGGTGGSTGSGGTTEAGSGPA